MSETGRSGRSVHGRNEREGRGRGRVQGYTRNAKIQKRGLCKALDHNVFDYGHKAAADEMRTSWEKLVQYAGTSYGQDISNELHNKTTVVIPEPLHTAAVINDPMLLYRLIEKTILAQTEDQYPFATEYEQEASFYSFRQAQMTNPQWYDRFNTKVDVGEAIGVTREKKVLLEYVAQELHQKTFVSLTRDEQHAVRTDAEERYIAYAFLRQRGAQHANLKMDLQNDYTTRDNHYPKNRQQTLHLLDRYSKTVVPEAAQSEGGSFAQKGGRQAHKKIQQRKSIRISKSPGLQERILEGQDVFQM
jgi:hypothetical protein